MPLAPTQHRREPITELMPQNLPITPAENAAQDWILRLTSGEVSEADLNAFKAWRDADPANLEAFQEIRALWNDLESLGPAFAAPSGATPPTDIPQAPQEPAAAEVVQLDLKRNPRRTGHRVALGGMLAACLMLVGLFASDISTVFKADFITGVGEQASLSLPDGSNVHLNTDSAIALDFTSENRNIILLQGEALFEVRKDPDRPFNVKTLEGTSTAIGTSYAVRSRNDNALVTVIEGRVRVSVTTGAAAAAADRVPHVDLTANQQVSYQRGGPLGSVTPIKAEEAAAWRRGLILIDGLSFADAVAEIDRYRPGQIIVLRDSTEIEPITARIALQEIDGGLKALATLHGLSVTQMTGYLTILH